MGVTHVTAQVSNLAKTGTAYEAEFLVDSGSIDCLVPSEALQAAGVEPEGKTLRCVHPKPLK